MAQNDYLSESLFDAMSGEFEIKLSYEADTGKYNITFIDQAENEVVHVQEFIKSDVYKYGTWMKRGEKLAQECYRGLDAAIKARTLQRELDKV